MLWFTLGAFYSTGLDKYTTAASLYFTGMLPYHVLPMLNTLGDIIFESLFLFLKLISN